MSSFSSPGVGGRGSSFTSPVASQASSASSSSSSRGSTTASSTSSSSSSSGGSRGAPPRKRGGSGSMTSPGSLGGNNIQVLCRFRPSREPDTLKWFDIQDDKSVTVNLPEKSLDFNFDRIFAPNAEQKTIYASVEHVVNGVMEGFNGSILTYGQTSSGKTHTMLGKPEVAGSEGVVPRAMESLFRHVAQSGSNTEFTFKCSYVELYCERINDLLSPNNENLKIREDAVEGIVIAGVTEVYVSNCHEVMKLLDLGRTLRATSSTLMNAESSRSHALLFVTVTQKNTTTLHVRRGKLVLVDLAGSEKVSKTGAEGMRLEEAKNINRSLTTLGMVIKALSEGQSFVPTRDSKLTRVLEESLGGNSRTTLIICCAPELIHSSETVSTLRFGERAKQIKNRAVINEEMSIVEIKLLLEKAQQEIVQLKALVKALRAEKGGGGGGADDLPPPPPPPHTSLAAALLYEDQQQVGGTGVEGGDLVLVSPGGQARNDGDDDEPTSSNNSWQTPSKEPRSGADERPLVVASPVIPPGSDVKSELKRLATLLAEKEAENSKLRAQNEDLAARLLEEEKTNARYEEESQALESRVRGAEAQVEQLLRLKTAEPVPPSVIQKAYGTSTSTATSTNGRPADIDVSDSRGVGNNNTVLMMGGGPSSPLSASVYDKKLESVEKIIYALQDELFEQREAFQTIIRSKQEAFKELLQQNGELALQKEAYLREIFQLQCKLEDLDRVVKSLTQQHDGSKTGGGGGSTAAGGGGGFASLFGLGRGGLVVKTILGGGGGGGEA